MGWLGNCSQDTSTLYVPLCKFVTCQVAVESSDLMRYNAHEITVPASCSEVEVTLKDPGNLSAQVMGHDWVLARDADMSATAQARASWLMRGASGRHRRRHRL